MIVIVYRTVDVPHVIDYQNRHKVVRFKAFVCDQLSALKVFQGALVIVAYNSRRYNTRRAPSRNPRIGWTISEHEEQHRKSVVNDSL